MAGARFGMHSSLWTAEWTKEAAERVVPMAARHGLDVIEIALLNPGTGTVDFEATIRALAATGFQGDLVDEAFINMPPALAKALSIWRPVAKCPEEVLDPGMTYLE